MSSFTRDIACPIKNNPWTESKSIIVVDEHIYQWLRQFSCGTNL